MLSRLSPTKPGHLALAGSHQSAWPCDQAEVSSLL